MAMNKTIKSIVIGVTMVLVSGVVYAEAATNTSNPFQVIWATIEDLKNQIINIQLIPGPQGPVGPEGPAGPQGLQGVQGLVGPQGPAGGSAYQLPEYLKPVIPYGQVQVEGGPSISIFWDSNSVSTWYNELGKIKLNNAISWGTLTVTLPDGSTRTKSANGSGSWINFHFGDSGIPNGTLLTFAFTGNIYWQGFLIPINMTGNVQNGLVPTF